MIILGAIFSDIEFGMTISWDTDDSIVNLIMVLVGKSGVKFDQDVKHGISGEGSQISTNQKVETVLSGC